MLRVPLHAGTFGNVTFDSKSVSVLQVNESVEVLVENVNDNPPNFAQNHYVLEVNEVSGDGLPP